MPPIEPSKEPANTDTLEITKDDVGWDFHGFLELLVVGFFSIYKFHSQPLLWVFVVLLLAVYVHPCTLPKSVVIHFNEKTAVYKYPSYMYFKKEKCVSLSDYTLAYLSGSHKLDNFSIHLSNRKGAHLKLLGAGSIQKFLNFEQARDMTDQLAKGLGIKSSHFS
jgi:hypothetical protein